MEFPRFTSGGSGKLTFAVLNDVFSRIEKLEEKARAPRARVDMSNVCIGQLVSEDPNLPGNYEFFEVGRSGGAYIDINGLKSTAVISGQTLKYQYPAIAPTGLASGTNLAMLAMPDDAGTLEFVALVPSSNTRVYIITASAAITANVKWSYTVRDAEWVPTSNAFVFDSTVNKLAYNGAENVGDATTYGVGFIPNTGGTVTLTRKPIKVGVAVVATATPDGYLTFCVPNGYEVSC